MIRTTYQFLRMIRQMKNAPLPLGETQMRGAEFRILYEPEQSYRARRVMAERMGEKLPAREMLYEVSYWPVAGQPCNTQRGATLAEALRKAIDAPFPASLA